MRKISKIEKCKGWKVFLKKMLLLFVGVFIMLTLVVLCAKNRTKSIYRADTVCPIYSKFCYEKLSRFYFGFNLLNR